MSLEKLAEKIASAAKVEADEIIKAANEQASEIIDSAKNEAGDMENNATEKVNKEVAQLSVELVASAKQTNQKRALIAKREELDNTWKSIRELVGSGKLSGRKALLESMVKDADNASNKGMVLKPVGIDRGVLSKTGSSFKIGDDVDGLGGFILVSADGSISLDYRFDSRLDACWNENIQTVSNILFE
jgi:V/A-type H+-transporting ATPase subunit E